MDEAIERIAPLVGIKPEHLAAYIAVGITSDNPCMHIGGSDNVPYVAVPAILRAMASEVEKDIARDSANRQN